jgi:hypothetical protein
MKKSLSQSTKRVKEASALSPFAIAGNRSQTSTGQSKLVNSPRGNEAVLPGTRITVAWNSLVPKYESKVHGVVVMHLLWDRKYAEQIEAISPKRAGNRVKGYLDLQEMERAWDKHSSKGEASIRFGAEKTGHGYSGERGDFCLVGGVIRGKNLSLFYRSLEMIGGFAYDLTLIKYLQDHYFGFSTVTIYATKAFVFALKGNSNEKLFPKLQKIFV